MTDDPSTNSGEWVCAYADNEFVTDCTEDSPHYICSPPAVTPSPVPDSERPGTISRIWERLCHAESAAGYDRPSPPTWDDIDTLFHWADDAHRCPTPEGDVLAELRAENERLRVALVNLGESIGGDMDEILDAVNAAQVALGQTDAASHPGGAT